MSEDTRLPFMILNQAPLDENDKPDLAAAYAILEAYAGRVDIFSIDPDLLVAIAEDQGREPSDILDQVRGESGKVIAYLDIAMMDPRKRFYYQDDNGDWTFRMGDEIAPAVGTPGWVLAPNGDWGSYVAEFTNPEFQGLLRDNATYYQSELGFDQIFADDAGGAWNVAYEFAPLRQFPPSYETIQKFNGLTRDFREENNLTGAIPEALKAEFNLFLKESLTPEELSAYNNVRDISEAALLRRRVINDPDSNPVLVAKLTAYNAVLASTDPSDISALLAADSGLQWEIAKIYLEEALTVLGDLNGVFPEENPMIVNGGLAFYNYQNDAYMEGIMNRFLAIADGVTKESSFIYPNGVQTFNPEATWDTALTRKAMQMAQTAGVEVYGIEYIPQEYAANTLEYRDGIANVGNILEDSAEVSAQAVLPGFLRNYFSERSVDTTDREQLTDYITSTLAAHNLAQDSLTYHGQGLTDATLSGLTTVQLVQASVLVAGVDFIMAEHERQGMAPPRLANIDGLLKTERSPTEEELALSRLFWRLDPLSYVENIPDTGMHPYVARREVNGVLEENLLYYELKEARENMPDVAASQGNWPNFFDHSITPDPTPERPVNKQDIRLPVSG